MNLYTVLGISTTASAMRWVMENESESLPSALLPEPVAVMRSEAV